MAVLQLQFSYFKATNHPPGSLISQIMLLILKSMMTMHSRPASWLQGFKLPLFFVTWGSGGQGSGWAKCLGKSMSFSPLTVRERWPSVKQVTFGETGWEHMIMWGSLDYKVNGDMIKLLLKYFLHELITFLVWSTRSLIYTTAKNNYKHTKHISIKGTLDKGTGCPSTNRSH